MTHYTSTASNITITGPIVGGTTPIITNGASNILVLSPSNYGAGTGGVAVGTQIPTDITMQEETAPASPPSSPLSQRLFADISTHDLSVKDSSGNVTDVEHNAILEFFCIGTFPVNTTPTTSLNPGSTSINCSGTVVAELRAPFSGTVKNLYVSVGTAGNSGESATVFVNGSGTGTLTCGLVGVTQCNDTNSAHFSSVTAGQTISIRVTGFATSGEAMKDMRASVQIQ